MEDRKGNKAANPLRKAFVIKATEHQNVSGFILQQRNLEGT